MNGRNKARRVVTAEVIRKPEDVERICWENAQRRARREAFARQEARRAEAERKAAKWRLGIKLASAAVCLICVLLGLGVVAQGGGAWMGCLAWASGALAMVIGGW